METQRTEYFDIAKAYLIMLVVIGHLLIVLNPAYDKKLCIAAQEFIYSFHMAAFFILHGVLFNNEKWKNISSIAFIRKRFYSLVIPYFFFEILGIICRRIFQGQAISKGIWNLLTIHCNVGADWFLMAMLIGNLLLLIFVKHPNRIYAYVSTMACLLIPMCCSGSRLLIVLGRGMLAYSFIMIGNLAKSFFKSNKIQTIPYILTAFIVTGLCAVIGLKFSTNDFSNCVIENPLLLVLGGCTGTVMTLGISQKIQPKLAKIIGQHTLTIMGTHQLVIYAMTSLIPGIYGGSVIMGMLLLLVIIVFEIPTVYLIDRQLPFLVGRKVK